MILLRIEHLTKIYGEKKAVDDLSLHILPGEIFGFIGHNGAGKSTTIKSTVGILKFDEGTITICGKNIKDYPVACKKDLAYIPDNPDLYEFMSGIKYLNFIADIFAIPADVRQEKIRKYADLFELTQDLGQPVSAYSHGMKQKLAVISAWLHDPKLIVMDVKLLPDGAIRILVKADLETIKERFRARMHGDLPAPVALMLERRHWLCADR